jgi:predicted dehydrogenase
MATRWGVMGCGRISSDFVKAAQTLNEDEHKFVVCATASDAIRAEEFSKEYNIERYYGSYVELAQDPNIGTIYPINNVSINKSLTIVIVSDVVYIGTLTKDHLEHCKLMMDHGKNVVCEKSLGVNVQQVKEVIEYAKEKNVFLMEVNLHFRQQIINFHLTPDF